MPTNNAINLNGSGIVSYDGAGTFNALANPLTVSNGGSSRSSTTAYAVECAGTTSTGAHQSIASVGTSGQILTSNGAGALPTFQTISGSGNYTFQFASITANPADGVTCYFQTSQFGFDSWNISSLATTNYYIPKNSTINSLYGAIYVNGTLGSANNCTLAIRVNDTTDTNLTTSLQLTSATNTLTFTSIGLSLNAGDYFSLKFVAPTWTTNPTNVYIAATMLLST